MDQLGPKQVIAYARRLGLTSPLPPYLSVALGAAEATLLEMTSAYSVFPNQGVRMRPYSVLKVDAIAKATCSRKTARSRRTPSAPTPPTCMTNLLRGVVQRGTGAKAAALNWPLGGKTGTTDDYTRRLVRRLRSGHHARRVGGIRPEETARARQDRRRRRRCRSGSTS